MLAFFIVAILVGGKNEILHGLKKLLQQFLAFRCNVYAKELFVGTIFGI